MLDLGDFPFLPQSTGLKSSSNDKFDNHWTIKSTPEGSKLPVEPSGDESNSALISLFETRHHHDNMNAKWIHSGINIPGFYIFETMFDWPDVRGATCDGTLSFRFSAIDYVQKIILNGKNVYSCNLNHDDQNDMNINIVSTGTNSSEMNCEKAGENEFQNGSITGKIVEFKNSLQFVIYKQKAETLPKGDKEVAGFLYQFDQMYIHMETCQAFHPAYTNLVTELEQGLYNITGLNFSNISSYSSSVNPLVVVVTVALFMLPVLMYYYMKVKRTKPSVTMKKQNL